MDELSIKAFTRWFYIKKQISVYTIGLRIDCVVSKMILDSYDRSIDAKVNFAKTGEYSINKKNILLSMEEIKNLDPENHELIENFLLYEADGLANKTLEEKHDFYSNKFVNSIATQVTTIMDYLGNKIETDIIVKDESKNEND